MGDRTGIEWTDATWTPIRARWFEPAGNDGSRERVGWHCERVSEACRNCYAEGINRRLGTGLEFKPGHLYREEDRGYRNGEVKVFLDETMLLAPLRWSKPRDIFVCSMTDLFGAWVPDWMIDRVFAVMALCPQHTFQVLTKRSARMRAWATETWQPAPARRIPLGKREFLDVPAETRQQTRWDRINKALDDIDIPDSDAFWTSEGDLKARSFDLPLPQVWLGVSAEDQTRADERVPDLLATPAAVRFVSAEPLLGPIRFNGLPAWDGVHGRDALTGKAFLIEGAHPSVPTPPDSARLDWIIVGGESGPGARPMHPDWARAIRDQCAAAGVPFFFKQWGAWGPGEPFDAHQSARAAYRGEILTLQRKGAPDVKMAVPTRLDDSLGPALTLERFGKKVAGRQLDGRTHDGRPERST